MKTTDSIKAKGEVEIIIEYNDGNKEIRHIKNAVLRKGREALAASLANEIGNTFDFFIVRMLFGDNGTSGGVPKSVNSERTGLFGTTKVSKVVVSQINSAIPSQVVFTSVLTFSEGNGLALSEMALQMNNNELYSMTTFADLNKTSSMQITWNWNLSFV